MKVIDVDLRSVRAVIVSRDRPIGEESPPFDPARGWYGDPASSEPLRYWTGEAWADGGTDRPPQ